VERGYFTTNAALMDYPDFRARGLPIGSGAVESAAKHVVQIRMKRSGMRWSDTGGQAMLALCAYRASHRPLHVPGYCHSHAPPKKLNILRSHPRERVCLLSRTVWRSRAVNYLELIS
jgi:hypothetical protein